MAVSPAILGLGYLVWSRNIHGQWQILSLIIAHAGIGFPLAVRTLQASFDTMPSLLPLAARVMGATNADLNRSVYRPWMRTGLVNSACFVFAMSLGDLTLGLLLAPNGFTTITMVLYRLVAAYRFQQAAALGGVMILVAAIGFGLISLVGRWYGRSHR
jgi:ABC-type Fe3+ transport system permease subunit